MIPLNQEQVAKFLAQNGIKTYNIKQVAGDASFRSYYRIFTEDKSYILMFAPPPHEDIRPFENIDKFLCVNQFSAPQIFARDEENGFLLLKDLGDDTYGRVLKNDNSLEFDLYKNALDVLLKLHQIKAPQDLQNYNHALLFREVMLFPDWYLQLKNQKLSLSEISEYKHIWFEIFDLLSKENQVLVLRDYHADNLMILPQKTGFQSVGLLDFQDAVIGCKAYDLVSLLEDARRDVKAENVKKLLQYYLEKSQVDEKSFMQDYEILSLQRNIKIIGIFARLSIRDKKDSYLQMIPRVSAFVENRLNSDSKIFSSIKPFLKKFL